MAKQQQKQLTNRERRALIKQCTNLIIERAGVSREAILDVAFVRWAKNNSDLLTPAERRKYLTNLKPDPKHVLELRGK